MAIVNIFFIVFAYPTMISSNIVTNTTNSTQGVMGGGGDFDNGTMTINSNGTDNSGNSGPGGGGGTINLGGMTLEDFCQKYIPFLPLEQCTCNNTMLTKICDLIKKRDSPPLVFPGDKIKASLLIIASVLGIIGNGFVILVTVFNWKKYNYCHKLVGGLAISDLIFSIFQIIEAIPILWTYKWLYGDVMCKIILGAYNLSAWISIGLILVIAIERYFGIVRPFSNGIHAISINLMVMAMVITGIALIVPMLIVLEVITSGRCAENPNQHVFNSKAYSWAIMFIGFIIPLVVISTLYGKIIIALWKGSTSKALSNKQQKKRLKENKRIMVILISVLVFFVLLVFPIRIIWILNDHGVLEYVASTTFDALRTFSLVSYSFHAAVNPIIYSAIDRKFRQAMRELFNMKNGRKMFSSKSSFKDTNKDRSKGRGTNSNSTSLSESMAENRV